MKSIHMLVGAAALALTATPALAADFSGPRIGANVGYAEDGGEGAFTYAVNAGYDFQFAESAVVGVFAEVGDSDETGRDLVAGARVGGVVSDRALVYVHGAYTNLDAVGFNFEGIRGGLGAELAVTDNLYINAEYRYSNYDSGVDFHGGVIGAGFRF